MKFHFKQAVHLNGRSYNCGYHLVPSETQKLPFFLRLKKAGLVIAASEPTAPKSVDLTALPERQKKLADKLAAESAKKKADSLKKNKSAEGSHSPPVEKGGSGDKAQSSDPIKKKVS